LTIFHYQYTKYHELLAYVCTQGLTFRDMLNAYAYMPHNHLGLSWRCLLMHLLRYLAANIRITLSP